MLKTIFLAGAICTLAACACPVTDDYNRAPYLDSEHGTAGSGVAVYEGRCPQKDAQAEPRIQHETTVYKQAEPVFREKQRK